MEIYCESQIAKKSWHVASLIAERQTSGSDAKSLLYFDAETSNTDAQIAQKQLLKGKEKKKKSKNHQIKIRKDLREVKKNQKKNLLEREAKAREEVKRKEHQRKKTFGHVKARVFERNVPFASASETTNSTATSSISSISSISRDATADYSTVEDNVGSNIGMKHKYFGRIPKYILERRIAKKEDIKEHTSIEDGDEVQNVQSTLPQLKGKEREVKLNQLTTTEKQLRADLLKLPFPLKNPGTIKRRSLIEQKLNVLKEERKHILERQR